LSCEIKGELCGGKCTGYDGSKIWEKRMKINEGIECETCRDEAIKLEKFSHDIVNARIGKKIFDKPNFKKHVQIIKCLCDKMGVC